MGVKGISVGGVVRYARSFYNLLGNRRKFERVPLSGPITVTCKGFVVDTTQVSSCVDMSRRGIGIECPEPLAVDGVVQVHSEDHGPRRHARVRYCIQRGDRYRVGLEFIAEPQ
jgi:hypothetical protein